MSLNENAYTFSSLSYKIDRKQNRVAETETPSIFSNISAKEYKTLAPFAVRRFLQDYKKAKIFLRPKMADYTRFQWAKWYIKNKGLLPSISIWIENYKYKKVKWKTANQKLLDYINGKIE